jgi:hypothetical protein
MKSVQITSAHPISGTKEALLLPFQPGHIRDMRRKNSGTV